MFLDLVCLILEVLLYYLSQTKGNKILNVENKSFIMILESYPRSGPCFNIKTVFHGMEISIIKIRR